MYTNSTMLKSRENLTIRADYKIAYYNNMQLWNQKEANGSIKNKPFGTEINADITLSVLMG